MASDGDRLVEFVRAAKARSVPDDSLAAMLRNAGWPERRIAAALTAYYEGEVGLAVPERGGRAEYAREAFFYLVAFVTLAIWAVAFGHLLYALIDRAFADPLNASYAGSFRDELRRLARAGKVARIDRVDSLGGQIGRERARLRTTGVVERRVGVALEAPVAVPVGLAMPDEEKLRHLEARLAASWTSASKTAFVSSRARPRGSGS